MGAGRGRSNQLAPLPRETQERALDVQTGSGASHGDYRACRGAGTLAEIERTLFLGELTSLLPAESALDRILEMYLFRNSGA